MSSNQAYIFAIICQAVWCSIKKGGCPNCNGNRQVEDEDTGEIIECPICEGDGFIWEDD